MKKLIRRLARLYPHGWRARYGKEFDALLEDTKLNWLDALNVIAGALQMQVKTCNARNIVLAAAATGAILGFAISSAMPPRKFTLTSVIKIIGNKENVDHLIRGALGRKVLKAMIEKEGLYPTELQKLPADEVVAIMRKSFTVSTNVSRKSLKDPTTGSRAEGEGSFRIGFSYEDPLKAQRIANDFTQAFFEVSRVSGPTIKVLAPADTAVPVRPVETPLLLGGAAGALFGLTAVLARRWRVARVRLN